MAKGKKNKANSAPAFDNRRARFDYEILDTLEVGIALLGSEVKALRLGRCSLAEGYVAVEGFPPSLFMHSVNIGQYPPAGPFQHDPVRVRRLLAHRSEIEKLARQVEVKGMTLVPLRMYFKGPVVKVQIGVARGKAQHDKRHAIRERENLREYQRTMSRRV
jgi:SsrA-binding protein